MSDTTPGLFELQESQSAPSVRIFCPDCDYDLSGLAENRCPECGEEFNGARLRSWTTETGLIPTVGPRSEVSYVALALMTLFQPARLARSLPPYPSCRAVFLYSIVLRILATAAFPALTFIVLSIAQPYNSGSNKILALMQAPLILASLGCELVIAGLLGWLVEPRAVRPLKRFRFWYTTTSCFCVYLLITSVLLNALCLVMSLATFKENVLSFLVPGFFIIPILMILCWWRGLGTVISVRGLPSIARTGIVFLVPIIGFIAIVLGYIIGSLQVLILHPFRW